MIIKASMTYSPADIANFSNYNLKDPKYRDMCKAATSSGSLYSNPGDPLFHLATPEMLKAIRKRLNNGRGWCCGMASVAAELGVSVAQVRYWLGRNPYPKEDYFRRKSA